MMKNVIFKRCVTVALSIILACTNVDHVYCEENNPESTSTPTTQNDVSNTTSYSDTNSIDATSALTDTQRKSLTMQNYLQYITQTINDSKNNRLYLEEVQTSLLNNTVPSTIDEDTEEQINSIFSAIESYQMIDVKRDRLQYIYDQNQAQAIRNAIPSPMSLLNVVASGNIVKLAMSVSFAAINAKSSYDAYKDTLDLQYLQDNWDLDDKEKKTFDKIRTDSWKYTNSVAQKYGLPDTLTFTPDTCEYFVQDILNNSNNTQKIQNSTDNENIYEEFGPYWLTLAECYFKDGDYENCLNAFDRYEELHVGIFREDRDFAKDLPLAISSVEESNKMSKAQRIKKLRHYLFELNKNIEENVNTPDWELRYFEAQTYVALYRDTKDENDLKTAYNLTKKNLNYLVKEQEKMNEAYLKDVEEVPDPDPVSDNASDEIKKTYKQRKKDVKAYNKMLHEVRKTELPPVYEPLAVNTELLFALADKLNISDTEKRTIDGILSDTDLNDDLSKRMFLVYPIDDDLSFTKVSAPDYQVSFDKNAMTIPAVLTSDDASITVTVTEPDGSINTIDDWTISEVKRDKDNKTNPLLYEATYKSKSAGKIQYNDGDIVTLSITPTNVVKIDPTVFTFKAIVSKKFRVLSDTSFERIQ